MQLFKYPLMCVLAYTLVACSADQEAHAADSDAKPAKASASAEGSAPTAEVEANIRAKFLKVRPDLEFSSVTKTSFPGLYELEFTQGGVIYTTESGDFFVSGEIFKVEETGIVNLSEEGRVTRRQEVLANLDKKDLITFPAEGEDIRDIYVFTDVYCGFCAKLHNEVDQLAKLGIRVNYLAYPRGGTRSKAYPVMQSVWCSDDKNQAITTAKNGGNVDPVQCSSTAVLDQYDIGNRVGVSGTPAIMFEDGSLLAGYKPAPELAALAKSK